MRIVRAIRTRNRANLPRIARKLDPGLAASPYWLMPERMAALRLRYPGAPEHWLELLARSAMIPEAVPPSPPGRDSDGDAGPQHRFRTARSAARRLFGEATGIRTRPASRFPVLEPKAPVVATPPTETAAGRPTAAPPSAPPQSNRPPLKFAVSRVRNPIANLLRNYLWNGRKAKPDFPSHDDELQPEREAAARPDRQDLPRRGHLTAFPHAQAPTVRRSEWNGPFSNRQDSYAYAADLRWPSYRPTAPVRPDWPNETARAERHDPRFAALDDRWPELPPLIDEAAVPPLTARDEATLIEEQIRGTWSA